MSLTKLDRVLQMGSSAIVCPGSIEPSVDHFTVDVREAKDERSFWSRVVVALSEGRASLDGSVDSPYPELDDWIDEMREQWSSTPVVFIRGDIGAYGDRLLD